MKASTGPQQPDPGKLTERGRASFDINAWALDELGFLADETIWHPDNAQRFIDDFNAHRSVDWRQEAGRTLTQIGRAANTRFWPTPTEKLTKTGPADPYSLQMEESLAHRWRCWSRSW